MRQAQLETPKLSTSLSISRSPSLVEPMPITAKIVSIECMHRQVLRT